MYFSAGAAVGIQPAKRIEVMADKAVFRTAKITKAVAPAPAYSAHSATAVAIPCAQVVRRASARMFSRFRSNPSLTADRPRSIGMIARG